MTRSLCFFACCLAAAAVMPTPIRAQAFDPGSMLAITEVMWKSAHPSGVDTDDDGEVDRGGKANGDWFELTNLGTSPLDIGGYTWDDKANLSGGFTEFPSIEIQPMETIIVLQEDDSDEGFRAAWGLPDDLRILSECLTDPEKVVTNGTDSFSGISSGGDVVSIFAPGTTSNPIISITVGAAAVSTDPISGDPNGAGISKSWGVTLPNTVTDLGLNGVSATSTATLDGAYQAYENGDEVGPPYTPPMPFLDIASPGYVEGLDTATAPGTQPTLMRLFPNEPHLNCPLSCDADGDGDCDLADLDALYMANGTDGANGTMGLLDMDDSMVIDADDIDEWLIRASKDDNPHKLSASDTFVVGDTDLNGVVDSSDLGDLLAAFGTNGPGWGNGDFNLDNVVNSSDLGPLLANFGHPQTPESISAVPEPSGFVLLMLAFLGLFQFGRRK